ncbi:hypothetical protein OIU74_023572 [Salix koriyanagi]|uniref:Uncharacterized protein n=1 Tax=Salix koriyanagi TaxID=2511006 RepID=A0A9Q0WCF3_9ROSI|nr:hypothetical protein OIU74_023572 [Salix koriyanagi]
MKRKPENGDGLPGSAQNYSLFGGLSFIGGWRSNIPASEQSISYHRDDFDDDDVDDLSLLPSDISIFFLDSTCGWLSPSLEALNESLSFCPNDSAIRASNELNKDIIVIETWIKEVGCVYFESN